MDFVVLLMARKWAIAGIVLFCGVAAVALTYMMPQTFQSQATMLPPDRLSSSGLLSKFNSGFALEMLKEVENPSVDLLQNILESRSLSERLARDSTIRTYFALEGKQDAAIVESVQKSLKVEPGFTKVSVDGTVETAWFPTASEKERARLLTSYIANVAIACMDSTLRAAISSMAHTTRLYADSDYALERGELDSLDRRQERFEQEHGVVKLESQTEAEIGRVGELKAQRDQAEIQLHLLSLDLSTTATTREASEEKLNEAERAATTYETEHQIGPALDSLPEINRAYAEMLRDRKELELIVNFLRLEVEQQRIFEVREKSLITVVDTARPPETRISPIRSETAFLGLIVGVALSILYIAAFSISLSWASETKSRSLIRSVEADAASTIFPWSRR